MRITTYQTHIKDNVTVLVKEESINYKTLSRVSNPKELVEIMNNIFNMDKLAEEQIYLICFNSKGIPQGFFLISQGSIDHSILSIRSIFNRALLIGAACIFLAHNHPSGDCSPSKNDILVTERVKEAGKLLEIPLVDHIIIGNGHYYSFQEKDVISC